MTTKTKSVLVFGVFDRLHPGHRFFLSQAGSLAERLIVVVAQDSSVLSLKGKTPSQTLEERIQALRSVEHVDEVVAGDTELGTYTAVLVKKPDIIAFGHDQTSLQEDLERFLNEKQITARTVTIKPYKPEKYKSSLLAL